MKHSINLYNGEYEIITSNDGIKYLSYCGPHQKPPTKYTFTTQADSKEFIRDIVKLDLDNEDAIKGFLKERGLPINTESASDHPTYCGIPIAKDYAQRIAPSSGISMSLSLFRYNMELIRNILRLSTEISLYEKNPPAHFASDFAKTLYEEERSQSVLKLVQSFLSLLYQPYTMHETLYSNSNWVLGGSTPMSRFTYYFHCILLYIAQMNPKYIYADYISTYNHSLQNLCHKNLSIYQKLNSENHNPELDDPFFHPIQELELEIEGVIIYKVDEKKFKEKYPDTDMNSINPKDIPLKVKMYPVTSSTADYLKRKYKIKIAEKSSDNEIKKLAYDSINLGNLADFLVDMENYFDVSYKNPQIHVAFKDTSDINSLHVFLDGIIAFGKRLIIENINMYTSNINYTLSIEENGEYKLQLISGSLLQSLFLKWQIS